MMDRLTFEDFRKANLTRCLKWHPNGINSWSTSDWLTALTGELGELASLIKMRNRERDGLPGNKLSPTDKMVADEIADVFTYLDLLAASLGFDLGRVSALKFNEVSQRVGFPDRISVQEKPGQLRMYVAGPMTGYPDLNFPAFHRETARLRSEGAHVINPAEINTDPGMSWEQCLRADIRELATCDAIVLLPGWEQSKGALLEHHIALQLGLIVLHAGQEGGVA